MKAETLQYRQLRDLPGSIDAPPDTPPCCAHAVPSPPGGGAARRSNLLWVVVWMTRTLLSFSVAALSVRALAKVLSVFETITIRAGSGLAILLMLVAVRPELRKTMAPRNMKLHVPRNAVQFLGQIAW